jgi:hypothetical protein
MRLIALLISCVLLVSLPSNSTAQRNKKQRNQTEQPGGSKDKKSEKSIADLTENSTAYPGLFTVYLDSITGDSYLLIPDSMLEQEFIYFSQVDDGVNEAGLTRGSYRGSKIISFHRHYDRIEVHAENTSYYFNPESPLSRAAGANLNTPILASVSISAQDTAMGFLISGDELFLSEHMQMVKPPSRGKDVLGKLNGDKTKIAHVNNYPENTELAVEYVYDNSKPEAGGAAVVDGRYITVAYHHALIRVPDEGFVPRAEDERVGYFTTKITDMTSEESLPWNDVIHRWRLEKVNPNEAVSDVVKPIVWWMENTTPLEFREYIRTGVEKWNLAFEAIGFRNAVEVRMQPDDATWDAGDIRYNVLRWTSSPSLQYSGYGPSFVNPRTGEILGADIMLEWAGMVGRLWRAEVFESAGMAQHDSRANFAEWMHRCDAGAAQAQQSLLGAAVMRAAGLSDELKEQFTRETLHRLVLHEVGHTLGLSHNMAGTTLHTPEELMIPEVVMATGLSNSVMDYPAIHFTGDAATHSKFYDDTPGPYDMWAIAYGYHPDESQLSSLLNRSSDPTLRFGNDADDMRRPGGGMNPDVNIYDLSDDPVAYAVMRCDLVRSLLPNLPEKFATDEQPNFAEVRKAYLTLSAEYATQLGVMTRQIGGVRYHRLAPSEWDGQPLVPVAGTAQKAAMEALAEYAFSPDAFSAESSIYGFLQDQRRGFGYFSTPEDPKIHARVLQAQKRALDHLMHPRVLQRIIDAGTYGNEYSIDVYFSDLRDALFAADMKTSVNSFRQQVQLEFVKRLIEVLDEGKSYDVISQSMALSTLKSLANELNRTSSSDALTKAHRGHVLHLIDLALNP